MFDVVIQLSFFKLDDPTQTCIAWWNDDFEPLRSGGGWPGTSLGAKKRERKRNESGMSAILKVFEAV